MCSKNWLWAIMSTPCVLLLILPGFAGSHFEKRGLLLLEGGEPASAVPHLRRAQWIAASWHTWTASIGPSVSAAAFAGWTGVAPDTVYALGRALLQVGGGAVSTETLAEAAGYFKLAILGNGNLWPAHANLATVQQRLGEPLAALESLRKAIDILDLKADGAPAPAEPDQVLAALFFQQGTVLEALPADGCDGGSCLTYALDAYRHAQEHAPSHDHAKDAVDRLALKISQAKADAPAA